MPMSELVCSSCLNRGVDEPKPGLSPDAAEAGCRVSRLSLLLLFLPSPMRPRQQIRIRQADLEGSMHSYLNAVLAHVHCHSPGMGKLEGNMGGWECFRVCVLALN